MITYSIKSELKKKKKKTCHKSHLFGQNPNKAQNKKERFGNLQSGTQEKEKKTQALTEV